MVRLDDTLADRQSQAGPADAAPPLHAVELVEDTLQIAFGYPDAAIGDVDFDLGAVPPGRNIDRRIAG